MSRMTTFWCALPPGLLAAVKCLALPPADWIKRTYWHDHLITLDELPPWKK